MNVEEATGIQLTESLAMVPVAAVCGIYLAHPESDYFDLGLIGRDQVADYAARKDITTEEVEYWLGTRLNYVPAPKHNFACPAHSRLPHPVPPPLMRSVRTGQML